MERSSPLAPMKSFDPERLMGGKNSADAFVILLATAYNDLRDELERFHELGECPTVLDTPSELFGEWGGKRVHLVRSMIGIVHELLEALKAASNAGILDDTTFRRS